MPGFPIIDVAIGIIFIYLTLSLVITATNELISSVLARRQKTLLLGIRNLLGDDLADKLYDHPLIRSLRNDGKRPSYIPSRSFALALLDLIEPRIASTTPPQTSDPRPAMLQARLDGGTTGQEAQPANAGQAVTPITLPESLQRALRVLLAEAEHDVEHFKIQLEQWFNNGMERVSGWYKRETQFVLLILAVLLTIGSNADTLKIVNTLWRDPTVRSATIAQSQAYVDQANKTATTPVSTPPPAPAEQGSDNLKAATKNLGDAIDRLDTLSLPLGWDGPCIQGQPCKTNLQIWPGFSRAAWLGALNEHSLGWLMTALAISLGAPFWFDMLNKVMSIRSAGKAPEEKPRGPRAVPQPQQPGQNA